MSCVDFIPCEETGMAERTGLFAGVLKRVRHDAHLSQAGLSKASGVPVSTIRGFEIGQREPTYGTLLKLARGLGVSLAAFDATDQLKSKPKKSKAK
jgi:transcriptional regulator with XRE-family HTH domain